MSTYPVYSSFFSTLYDEQNPVGNLGRGTHYSVLRCPEWLNVVRSPLNQAQVHDFAVIWDEDHDTRVISALEQIYMKGLLSPVQFIGERKACLAILVASRFYYHGTESDLQDYKQQISDISNNLGFDCWTSEVGSFDKSSAFDLYDHQCDPAGIIQADERKVIPYLKNIDNLWNLGTKIYEPGRIATHLAL